MRIHGTTGEAPLARFRREEAKALKPIAGIPPFRVTRELIRRVGCDCAIEIDGNAYSVPWQLIGESVHVLVTAHSVRVHHGAREIAIHAVLSGRHQRSIDPAHYAGVAGVSGRLATAYQHPPSSAEAPALLRPLNEYEALIGGGF